MRLAYVLLFSVEHRILQLFSGLWGDGVGDVPKGATLVLSAGHRDEQALGSLDDFDVVNSKVVETSARRRLSA